MKKYGKYEKRPKMKNILLQTYFTSLLCMVLCVMMFFGTSYAWFTSEVNNVGNEIHIGILDVDLLLDGTNLKDNKNVKVFDNTIFWEPGYTALRKLSVLDEGNLAFNYELILTSGNALDKEDIKTDLETVAKYFFVYVHAGDYAVDEAKPTSFKDIKESDKWAPVMHKGAVATLADILDPANDIAIAQGDSTDNNSDTYIIALHMDEHAGSDIMGHQINMNVKLVAYQKGSEQDGFNNSQYDNVAFVATVTELQAALDNASGETVIVLADDIAGDVTVTQKADVNIVIDGNNKTLTGSILVDGKSARPETTGLTIQNVVFTGVRGAESGYIYLGKKGDSNTRYTNNVTVKDCTFQGVDEGDARNTAAVRSFTGGDKNLVIDGCTIDNKMHSMLQIHNVEEGLKITNCKVYSKNGINLNNTPNLNMSGCDFNVRGYAVRFGESGSTNTTSKTFVIQNSTLKSACEENDDAVIIFRGQFATNATLILTNTTLDGNVKHLGAENAQIIEN